MPWVPGRATSMRNFPYLLSSSERAPAAVLAARPMPMAEPMPAMPVAAKMPASAIQSPGLSTGGPPLPC